MNIGPNYQLNQFIIALQDNNRIVVKTEMGIESFEIRSPSARLDNTYTTSYPAVSEKIDIFLRGNANQFNRDKLTEFSRVIESKFSLINSKRTGFFAFIILLFNRSRRERLNIEFRFYNQLNTLLEEVLRLNLIVQAPDFTLDIPLLPNNPSTSDDPQPLPLLVAPPSTSTPQPYPLLIPSPPPPSLTPPPPIAGAIPPPPPPPISNSLFPPPPQILPHEPAQPSLSKSQYLSQDEIQRGKTYIEEMERFLEPLRRQVEQLSNLENDRRIVEKEIAQLDEEITKCQQIINYLETPTSADFIPLIFPIQKGSIQLPVLTEKAYREYCESSALPSNTPAGSSIPTSSQDLQPKRSPGKQKGDTHSHRSADPSSDTNSKRGGFDLIRSRFQPQSQSTPTLSQPSKFRRHPSLPKMGRSVAPKPEFDVLNVPFIVLIERARITACEVSLSNLRTQAKQIGDGYELLQEQTIPNIKFIVSQKEDHLSTCQRLIKTRETNLQRREDLKKEQEAVLSSEQPQVSLIEQQLIVERSKKELLTEQYQQCLNSMKPEDAMRVESSLLGVKGKPVETIVEEYRKSFFDMIQVP